MNLRELFPIGSTCYTVLRHSSRSGMTRDISVLAVKDGEIVDASSDVLALLREKGFSFREGSGRSIRVSGFGFDPGFEVVYDLSFVLYGDGYQIDQRWI